MNEDLGDFTDEELVVEFQRAEDAQRRKEVSAALWNRTQRSVFVKCLHIVQDVVLAEDAAQETALTLLESLEKVREPEKFRAWLNKIATRKAQALHRARAKEPPVSDEKLDLPPEARRGKIMTTAQERRPEDEVVTTELDEKAVIETIKSFYPLLNQHDRLLYTMVYEKGMTGAEIAKATGDENDKKKVTKLKNKLVQFYNTTILAQQGHAVCAGLGAVVGAEPWQPSRVRLAAVDQHAKSCAVCRDQRERIRRDRAPLVIPLLFGSDLRDRIWPAASSKLGDEEEWVYPNAHGARNQSRAAVPPPEPVLVDRPRELPDDTPTLMVGNEPKGHLHDGRAWAVSEAFEPERMREVAENVVNAAQPGGTRSEHRHSTDVAQQIWDWLF